MGALQGTQTTQEVMEVWAVWGTGTFTILPTWPEGNICIDTAGTDFFEAEMMAAEKGTES